MLAVFVAQILSRPPAIAFVGGIAVGRTTIRQFERAYRRGQVVVGGHPRGARFWYETKTHSVIHADGFYYWGKEEIIDEVSIVWTDPDGGEPRIMVRSNDLGLLAKLRPGMTAAAIESALHLKLKDGTATLEGLIRYPRKPVNKDSDRFTTWTLRVDFAENSGASGFSVTAD